MKIPHTSSSLTLRLVLVPAAAALLTSCSGGSVPTAAPGPVGASAVADVPVAPDYVVTAKKGITYTQLKDAVGKLSALRGVSGASVSRTQVQVTLFPDISDAQRQAVLQQLAALGPINPKAQPSPTPAAKPARKPAVKPSPHRS